MTEKILDLNIVSGDRNPYEYKILTCFIVDDKDIHGKEHRVTGKLVAVFGKNLLFEQKSGALFLVNPAKASRIIELQDRRQ
jgi:hypothetical protein